jgi:CRISPR/Cas system Type II protein with McrA/HNH and RuvC-like nuclease domain
MYFLKPIEQIDIYIMDSWYSPGDDYSIVIPLDSNIWKESDERFVFCLRSYQNQAPKIIQEENEKEEKIREARKENEPKREYFVTKPRLRKEIMKRDNYTCAYCHRRLEIEEIQIDHKIPTSRGGETIPDNLCVSCRSCNNKKKNRTPEEFINSFVYTI